MRQIKFRVWDKKFKVMSQPKTLNEWAKKYVYFDDNEIEWLQYTGIKDKNGKEVYEGDIIKSVSKIIRPFAPKEETGKMSTKYMAVEYREHGASFCIVGSSLPSISQTISSKFYEVAGNIYENPELKDLLK